MNPNRIPKHWILMPNRDVDCNHEGMVEMQFTSATCINCGTRWEDPKIFLQATRGK